MVLCLRLWISKGTIADSGEQIYVTLRDEKRELMLKVQERRKAEDDRL